MQKADVSIIVTNFNKPPEQISECIESIKAQTVLPKEVIFVDDCSQQPPTHAYAISIALPKNLGVAEARAVGVKMSTGSLLLFVDADDKLAPDFIQQSMKVIANKDIAYPSNLLFGDVLYNELWEPPEHLQAKDLYARVNPGVLVSSMMHRRVYEKLGGFRTLPLYEDWDFWLRAMFNGYTFGRANTLLYYRQNKGSRNRLKQEVKSNTLDAILAPYELRGGKLVERKPNG